MVGGGSVTALLQTNADGQLALNCGIGKVLHSIVDFLCHGKMTNAKIKPTKSKVRVVLQVLTTTHYLVAAVHREISLCHSTKSYDL